MFCISHHYASIAAEGPPIWEKLEPRKTRQVYFFYNNSTIIVTLLRNSIIIRKKVCRVPRASIAPIDIPRLKSASESLNFSGRKEPVNITCLSNFAVCSCNCVCKYRAVSIIVSVPWVTIIFLHGVSIIALSKCCLK